MLKGAVAQEMCAGTATVPNCERDTHPRGRMSVEQLAVGSTCMYVCRLSLWCCGEKCLVK